jgi:hypothetical protein
MRGHARNLASFARQDLAEPRGFPDARPATSREAQSFARENRGPTERAQKFTRQIPSLRQLRKEQTNAKLAADSRNLRENTLRPKSFEQARDCKSPES